MLVDVTCVHLAYCHQEFQVPKMEGFLNPIKFLRLFWEVWVFSFTWKPYSCNVCQVEHLITDVNNMRAELQGVWGKRSVSPFFRKPFFETKNVKNQFFWSFKGWRKKKLLPVISTNAFIVSFLNSFSTTPWTYSQLRVSHRPTLGHHLDGSSERTLHENLGWYRV